MNKVIINGIDLYSEYGLLLSSKVISPPSPKVLTIDIPAADGCIDLTEAINGETKYNNREISLVFTKIGVSSVSLSTYRLISNKFHGKICEIVFSDIPSYYYKGRVSVESFETDKGIGMLEIVCDAEPYALEVLDSTDDFIWDDFNFDTDVARGYKDIEIDGEKTIDVYGSRKTVCPEIIVSSSMDVEFEGITYHLQEGTNKVVSIAIVEGSNAMKFTGTGTVTIKFRGGAL